MKHTLLNGAARTVLGFCLAAGALSACNQNGQAQSAPTPAAALPLEMTATTPTAIAPAPTVSALPPAPPVRVGQLSNPDDTYAYAEQADSVNDAFGDAPPDYGFDYGGSPNGWSSPCRTVATATIIMSLAPSTPIWCGTRNIPTATIPGFWW